MDLFGYAGSCFGATCHAKIFSQQHLLGLQAESSGSCQIAQALRHAASSSVWLSRRLRG